MFHLVWATREHLRGLTSKKQSHLQHITTSKQVIFSKISELYAQIIRIMHNGATSQAFFLCFPTTSPLQQCKTSTTSLNTQDITNNTKGNFHNPFSTPQYTKRCATNFYYSCSFFFHRQLLLFFSLFFDPQQKGDILRKRQYKRRGTSPPKKEKKIKQRNSKIKTSHSTNRLPILRDQNSSIPQKEGGTETQQEAKNQIFSHVLSKSLVFPSNIWTFLLIHVTHRTAHTTHLQRAPTLILEPKPLKSMHNNC